MSIAEFVYAHPIISAYIVILMLWAGCGYYLSIKRAHLNEVIESKNEQLEENQTTIINLQKALNSGMWEADCDENGEVMSVHFSDEFREIFALQDKKMWPDGPDSWLERMHPEDRAAASVNVAKLLEGKMDEYTMPYRLLNGKGEYRWVKSRAHAVLREDGSVRRIIGFVVDVTSDFETDFLTGKLTDKGFATAVTHYLEDKVDVAKYSILAFNLRNFKAINSLWGFDVGDKILRSFSTNLEESILEPIFLGRKGDHFFALVERTEDLLQRLEPCCKFAYHHPTGTFTVRSVCGIYDIYNTVASVDDMMDRARMAQNSITSEYSTPYAVYKRTMREGYVADMFAVSELDRAIANEEFKVYYQPVVECKTGKIASAEALVRWQHPRRGLLAPGAFLPALEESGYISRVDRYVHEHVYRMYHIRLKAGLPLVPISINYSWMDFYDDELITWLSERLKNSTIDPALIRAEITESSFSVLHNNVKELMDLFMENKVTLMLDDFGTGVSTLDMLQKYYFKILKIDMSFTRQLETNPRTANMIKTIIDMCHLLGIKVIAEGVENRFQVDFYRENSCDYIQGYYYYKPMPQEEFETLLQGQEALDALVDYRAEPALIPQSYYKSYVYYVSKDMQKRANTAADSILQLIGDNMGVGAVSGCYDANLSICYFNNLMAELLGYTREEFLAFSKGSYLNLLVPEDRDAYIKSESMVRYYRAIGYDGKPVHVKELRSNVTNRDGELQWVASVRKLDNLTDEELERIVAVRNVAEKDGFTGLLAKNAFFSEVDKYLLEHPHTECSMLIFDLDNFKDVNDVCGHIRGDEIILAVTKILRRTFRSGDFMGRFGGDEFMVFIKESSNKELVRARVENIFREAEGIYYAELNRPCTLSVGAFCGEDVPVSHEAIFELADKALYKAKKQGKAQLVFADELEA